MNRSRLIRLAVVVGLAAGIFAMASGGGAWAGKGVRNLLPLGPEGCPSTSLRAMSLSNGCAQKVPDPFSSGALNAAGYGGAMVDAVEAARRLSCRNNLMQINISLALYRDANDGKWPKNLQVLVEKKYLTPKALQCPSVNPHLPGAPVEYELVRTEGRNFADTDIIVYDHKTNHKDGRNVLLFNQQVQWLSEEDFKKRMGNEPAD